MSKTPFFKIHHMQWVKVWELPCAVFCFDQNGWCFWAVLWLILGPNAPLLIQKIFLKMTIITLCIPPPHPLSWSDNLNYTLIPMSAVMIPTLQFPQVIHFYALFTSAETNMYDSNTLKSIYSEMNCDWSTDKGSPMLLFWTCLVIAKNRWVATVEFISL